MEAHRELRTIGGKLGFEVPSCFAFSNPPFALDSSMLLVNARSAIRIMLREIDPDQVWMPSYLCHSMLRALGQCITNLRMYEVDSQLRIPSLEWLADVRHNDVVLFVDYFGFRIHKCHFSEPIERGAWVVEDASQALLTKEVGEGSDIVISSPRKFLPIPDGGLLSSPSGRFVIPDIRLGPIPERWWLKSLSAMILCGEHDLDSRHSSWRELLDQVSGGQPIGPFAMSETSKILIRNAFDYEEISRRRRKNYQVLLEQLHDIALFADLDQDTVPLGFPIVIEARDGVFRSLTEKRIIPTIHWRLDNIVPRSYEDSHRLSKEIITLPCDQRYDENDMEFVAYSVRRIL